MRRFVCLAVLLFFSVPFGITVAGCSKSTPVEYCNAGSSGPTVGQVASIQVSEQLSTIGESLNYGQIGQGLSATAFDCKGNSVSVRSYTYATTDMSIADIDPNNGRVCAGTWNRNSGGGVPDYTYCNAPAAPGNKYLAYVTATAEGAVSNPIPVFIHPLATSVIFGQSGAANPCTNDPDATCCPNTTTHSSATLYTPASCLSQGATAQLTARVYTNGTTNPADNITCKVGHLSFSPQNASIATIDPSSGVVTANQPGSTDITASISSSGSGSTTGFFSTCPPASIVLAAPGKTGSTISVALNNTQPIVATVVDTNGKTITGLGLEFNSTTPQTIPAGSGSVTPTFPGTATITASCQPGTCNPAPFSQIGLFGNGKPLTSNGITVTAPGTISTVIFAGSTSSQYLYPVDFTTSQPPALVKLPFVPNSMVITQDGSTIYLGSSQGLMTVTSANSSVGGTNTNVTGTVLSVSPNGGQLVVSDAPRQTISLVSSAGAVNTTYGGVATAAQWSPDSNEVYITTTDGRLLVHSNFTGWTNITNLGTTYRDVAVTVPSIGAYFASPNGTIGRSDCPSTTVGAGTPPATTNEFYPVADNSSTSSTDHVAATTDGKHILGANTASLFDLALALPTQTVNGVTTIAACPAVVTPGYFKSTTSPHPFTGIAATAINGIVPASNSAVAFVTYTGTSGLLPLYVPSTGALNYVSLTGGATLAPVSGVFSTDNNTFFAGTSGDNKVHLITVTGTTATDSATPLTPNLPDVNGKIVAPNLLVQRPKRSTS